MEPLRVGVIFGPDQVLEDWEIRLLRRISAHARLKLSGIYLLPHNPPRRRPPFLLEAALRLEKALVAQGRGETARLAELDLGDVPVISPAGPPFAGVDILLSHVRGSWPEFDAALAPEVWGYSLLLDEACSPAVFGVDEVRGRLPVTTVELLRKTPRGGEVLATTRTNTKLNASSNAAYAKDNFVAVIERELARRQRGVRSAPAAGPEARNPARSRHGLSDAATYVSVAAQNMGRRLFDAGLRRLGGRTGVWTILVGEGDILTTPLTDLVELRQPAGEFRADPFAMRHGGKTYVFFEAYRYRDRRGIICVGRLDGCELRDVVDLDLGPIHVSYPYVFRDGDALYMIPETYQRERVEVWKCTRFPQQWTLHATALEGRSPADSALVKHRGEWWLFTNYSSGAYQDHCNELHVFKVDGPSLRRLEPHIDNPVVIDGTRARMGGRPFERDGVLYRPAQVTSHGTYGYGLKLMRVTNLSLTEYDERVVRQVEPNRALGTSGCHHVDASTDFFVIDARRAYGDGRTSASAISLRVSEALDFGARRTHPAASGALSSR